MVRRRDDQIVLLQNLRQKERLAQAQVAEAETELERFEARILEKQGEIDRLKKKLRLL
jgi:outer membrane protein TolC